MSFLKRKRRAKAYTTRTLGDLISMPQSSVSKLENDMEVLGEERAKKFAEALEIPDNIMMIYRGVFPNYAKLAYKLFPDKIEEKLKKFVNDVFKEELKSNAMLNHELLYTISDSRDFFDWLEESDFTFCGFRPHIVPIDQLNQNVKPKQICYSCVQEISETSKKLGVLFTDVIEHSTKLTFQFFNKIIDTRYLDPDLSKYEQQDSFESLKDHGYQKCLQCAGIYPIDFLDNGHCRNCRSDNQPERISKLEMIIKKTLSDNTKKQTEVSLARNNEEKIESPLDRIAWDSEFAEKKKKEKAEAETSENLVKRILKEKNKYDRGPNVSFVCSQCNIEKEVPEKWQIYIENNICPDCVGNNTEKVFMKKEQSTND